MKKKNTFKEWHPPTQADLKGETPYFYSTKIFGRVLVNIKKKKKVKNGFLIVFSKSDSVWVGFHFWQEKNSEKAKHPRICPSFGGNMSEAQL